MKLKTETITVTPEMASSLMANCTSIQRPINLSLLNRYSQTMLRGDWRLTHQGIMLGTNKEVIDGQHRLRAVMLSGKTVDMMVTSVSDATPTDIKNLFDATDFGKPRSLGFILQSVHGVQNAMRTAAALRSISTMCVRFTTILMPDQAIDIYRLFKDELNEVNLLITNERSLQIGSLVGAFAFLLKTKEEKLVGFPDKVVSGVNLHRGDPAYVLRHDILNYTKRRFVGRLVPVICLWTMTAALAEMEGRTVTLLKTAYGPLDTISDMIPKEVKAVRDIIGLSPHTLRKRTESTKQNGAEAIS